MRPESRTGQSNFDRDPETFWRAVGARLDWMTPFSRTGDVSFDPADFRISWFGDGRLNAAQNCIDRHLGTRHDQIALIWEGDEPGQSRELSYGDIHAEVCRMANLLKAHGIEKGDRVTIYLPMIPEIVFAMLACARIGAVHSVVFAGFSPESLANRIRDCGAKLVITADEGVRGGRILPLKANLDEALPGCPAVETVVVVERTGADVPMIAGRDIAYADARLGVDASCPAEPMGADDPLFILYTSGSTGKPKGVVHSTGGYLAWAAHTHSAVFDYRPGEVFWCTADIGWITGHSYVVYGPLANGATTLLFEGVPHYPDASRFWQVCDRHRVNIFYTAPTAIRALMREGDAFVTRTSRRSLRLLASAGEPLNPEAWLWYHCVVGEEQCPILDTWWQTETGGVMISPSPADAQKPGSCATPLPGIRPEIVDADGAPVEGAGAGHLCIAASWPGQARDLFGDRQRFIDTYFSTYPGRYCTGDGARRDEEGYYWITGRVDDVINVSGHRIGTAEVENALVAHAAVAEAGVVGPAHPIKGQGIYCFVTLNFGIEPSEALRRDLIAWIRREIGAFAAPDAIQFAPDLPKTRSGKIMRRILRKIAENDISDLGDVSTLTNAPVIDILVRERTA
nr:acetate--CoA ligase [Sphingopyxis sp. PET50]